MLLGLAVWSIQHSQAREDVCKGRRAYWKLAIALSGTREICRVPVSCGGREPAVSTD